MKSPLSRVQLVSLVIAVAFLGGFAATYRIDARRAEKQAGRLALLSASFLRYGDDMAVIDWVRSLENDEELLAVRLTVQDREVASFGDSTRLLNVSKDPKFVFPSTWTIRMAGLDDEAFMQLSVAERIGLGPLAGAFSLALAALMGWWIGRSDRHRDPRNGLVMDGSTVKRPNESGSVPTDPQVELNGILHAISDAHMDAWICLDRQYRVQYTNKKVGLLWGRDHRVLVGMHILDLSPEPGLVEALELNGDTEVPRPFREVPVGRAVVERTPFGVLLRLKE